MPTPKTKRDIVLQSTFSSTATVATLSLGVDARFTTPNGINTFNRFEDSSSGTSDEATEYQMTFGASTGAIGVITISFIGEGELPAPDVRVNKTSAVSDIDPAPTTTTVTPLPDPSARYTRSWQQAALDQASQLVVQVGGVDVRVKADNGHSVTQTVTSTAIGQLVLTYSWKNRRGAEVIGGSLTFTASSVAGAGYSLGTATVSDSTALPGRTERLRRRHR
jgi:hypothetical protein